jgi:DNA/RNA-binding domain of Phe-tRNA-synthetase-like protein
MSFAYEQSLATRFPKLTTGLLHVQLPQEPLEVPEDVMRLEALALGRVQARAESEWPSIRAWRAVFSEMGLKPTQYRCASEALLRRLRKDGSLPRLTPLVDLCNAVSALHGVPVAAFDISHISGDLTVRPARGDETYLTFAGSDETPPTGEIIFADTAGAAHARRWCNRQSATSAVSTQTREALVVIEAHHAEAKEDVLEARNAIAANLERAAAPHHSGLLIGATGRFDFRGAVA